MVVVVVLCVVVAVVVFLAVLVDPVVLVKKWWFVVAAVAVEVALAEPVGHVVVICVAVVERVGVSAAFFGRDACVNLWPVSIAVLNGRVRERADTCMCGRMLVFWQAW